MRGGAHATFNWIETTALSGKSYTSSAKKSMWGGSVRLKVWAVLRLATGGATPHAPLAVQLSRPLRGASKQLFGAYLARFHSRVGTNVPAGDGIGARTYVSASPLMVVIVAFWSVPSKPGNVERSTWYVRLLSSSPTE